MPWPSVQVIGTLSSEAPGAMTPEDYQRTFQGSTLVVFGGSYGIGRDIALLAEERGWGTCMQECWARLRVELHAHFGLDENHIVYAGIAIGVPDPNNPVNDIYADRAPQHEVVEFRGF